MPLSERNEIPALGLGTWKLTEQTETERALSAAVSLGYRMIDTASAYKNEGMIGDALRVCGISREELFLQGKVWNKDRGYEKTLAAFGTTIKKLGVDYLDCYLIHWPASPLFSKDWEVENAETWRALEKLYRDGDARMIGVCNYAPSQLEALKKTADVFPMVNQFEYHPGCGAQDEIVEYCKAEGIAMEAWSPLGNGGLLSHPDIVAAAEQAGCTPAVLCLSWCLSKGVNPVTKSTSEVHLRENRTALTITLSGETIRLLDELEL